MGSIKSALLTLAAVAAIIWIRRPEKFKIDTTSNLSVRYQPCPEETTEAHFFFGGTSMLGRYLVESWKENYPEVCIINLNRKPCHNCDVSYVGDIRDTRLIEFIFNMQNSLSSQKITGVVLSIKPQLQWTSYREFIEVNYASLVEITKLAKQHGVKQVLYTSSIACSDHYTPCIQCTEETSQPLLTDYEAPYDLSKRIAEEYILSQNSDDFRTIAIRVSGIIGGDGDPFFHHRGLPFQLTFNSQVVIDINFAGNIADALVEVYRSMGERFEVCGRFFYYTGEFIYERQIADKMSQVTSKPLLQLPAWILHKLIPFWQWFRWTHEYYTDLDLLRMSTIPQTFDQSLFHKTFPRFKPKFTLLEALELIYKPNPEVDREL